MGFMREGFVNDGMFDWSQPVGQTGSGVIMKGTGKTGERAGDADADDAQPNAAGKEIDGDGVVAPTKQKEVDKTKADPGGDAPAQQGQKAGRLNSQSTDGGPPTVGVNKSAS